jgi:hypothetical protein
LAGNEMMGNIFNKELREKAKEIGRQNRKYKLGALAISVAISGALFGLTAHTCSYETIFVTIGWAWFGLYTIAEVIFSLSHIDIEVGGISKFSYHFFNMLIFLIMTYAEIEQMPCIH